MDLSRISDSNLIFLDETGFNEHTRRSYGYSLRNTKAYLNVPANRNANRSLICAISCNGVVAYDYRSGSYNSLLFKTFITNHLLPHFRAHPTHVLVMDNARFHKSTEIINFLREKRIVFIFTVPYAPQLNPIEEFFAMVKAKFNRLRTLDQSLTIERSLTFIFAESADFSELCKQFFTHMRSWLEKALRYEDFI